MKKERIKNLLGICFVVVGVVVTLSKVATSFHIPPWVSLIFWGVLSVISVFVYLQIGWKKWGLLIPVCFFSFMMGTTALSALGFHSLLSYVPIFSIIGLPFLVGFLIDPKKYWWAILPVSLMTALTVFAFSLLIFKGFWLPELIIASILIPLVARCLLNMNKWKVFPIKPMVSFEYLQPSSVDE